MSVKQIMLRNIDQVTDKDGLYQPSDALLDKIWKHTIATTKYKGLLMSSVVNGDEQVDNLQVAFAASLSPEDGLKLGQRLRELFRTYAYTLAEEHEYNVMEAINAPPEPEYA